MYTTLPLRHCKPFVLFTLACITHALNAQTSVLLPVTRDVALGYHDNYNTANTNYNTSIHFSAFSQPGNAGGVNKGRGLMDFDLSVIPSGSNILGAFLNLTAIGPFGVGDVAEVGHVGPDQCKLKRVTEAWNDNTVTWNTQPATTDVNATALASSTHALQNYYSIDVTLLVQDMINDLANSHGFMLQLDNETPTRGLAFHSGLAEHAEQRPTLLVVYGQCGVGMMELPNDLGDLQVFPNIASPGDVLVLDKPGSIEQAGRLEVWDAAGRMAWTTPIGQWPLRWAVPALSPGVYTTMIRDRFARAIGSARVVLR